MCSRPPLVSRKLRETESQVHVCLRLDPPFSSLLRRLVLLDDLPNPLLILRTISLIHIVRLSLSGRFGVGVIEKILDAEKDLFDGNGGLPCLFLVQDGQTDGAGRVDVGVEERRDEFACVEIGLAV